MPVQRQSGDRHRVCVVTPNHEVGVQLFTARRNFISNIILDYWSMVNAQKLLPHEHENSEYGNVPSTRFPATEELAFAPGFQMVVYRMSGDFSTKQQKKKHFWSTAWLFCIFRLALPSASSLSMPNGSGGNLIISPTDQ